MFHPFSTLARLAADCPGCHLGTACFILPLAHPLGVAEATATLDVICGGRLLFGVGQGYRVPEFQSFGIPRHERGARLIEAVTAIRTLWADDPASYEGRFYQFSGISITPKPIQRPGPPVWVVPTPSRAWPASPTSATPGSRAAATPEPSSAKQWPPTDEDSRSSGDHTTAYRCSASCTWAPAARQAEAEMKDAFRALYESYARWGQPGERYDLDFDELKQERILVGSPEGVAERLLEYQAEFDVPFMWFRLYYPGMDMQLALETIRLFGQEVIPLCPLTLARPA